MQKLQGNEEKNLAAPMGKVSKDNALTVAQEERLHFVVNTLATPLSMRQTVPGTSRSIFDWNGDLVANAVTEEQAQAFITAVNAHGSLIRALSVALDVIPETYNGVPHRGGKRTDTPQNRALDELRNALALVIG